ncbi:hypothetical protein [Bordetella bronchiseptica]|uniref:hypothetical protein n=1 Tax=Bordetella bronchiseptica TaxID=518 RepID=UPI00045A438D|nr:hypothetical protein [Bordetella bronchiseptica]KAK51366.1 hypothetical protein L576_3369 [Bordetella bronchiseptica OSU054]
MNTPNPPELTDDELMSLLPGAVRLPQGWKDTARAIEQAVLDKLRQAGEPLFWYRPRGNGLYEGPHHHNSVLGQMLRAEKPDQWKPLFDHAVPQASAIDFAGPYEGAREDLSIWKRRALDAERQLQTERETSSRLVAELNDQSGPTLMGEPAPQASADARCKRCGGPGWYTSHTTGYPESIPCSACNPQGVSVERLANDPFLAAQLWRKPTEADGSLLERILEHVDEYVESMASSTLLSVRFTARRNVETRIAAELAAPASAPAACAHQFHFFGDQKERRCNRCNVVESKASTPVAEPIQWPTMPASKGQSPVLFEDGYAEGWAKCMDECRRAVSGASAPVADRHQLRALVDVVWNEATESTAVPDTPWADRLIDKVFPSLSASAPVAGEAQPDDLNKRLLEATIRDLAAISEHLGLDPNEGGADPIIEAIDELRRERDDWVDAQYAAAGDAAPQAPAGWRWTLHPAGLHPDVYAAAAAHTSDEDVPPSQYDYQVLFDAIGKAVTSRADGSVSISVQAFRDALKAAPAPTAAEDSEDDMLTIAYLAGAQAEKERAGDALLAKLLDDPLLRDLLGYIEDTGPADVWGAAQAWMAKRNAALAARKEGDARASATQAEQGERDAG